MGLDAFLVYRKDVEHALWPFLVRCPGMEQMRALPYLDTDTVMLHIRGHLFENLSGDRLERSSSGPVPDHADVEYRFHSPLREFLREFAGQRILLPQDAVPPMEESSYFHEFVFNADFVRFIKAAVIESASAAAVCLDHNRGDTTYDTMEWSFRCGESDEGNPRSAWSEYLEITEDEYRVERKAFRTEY